MEQRPNATRPADAYPAPYAHVPGCADLARDRICPSAVSREGRFVLQNRGARIRTGDLTDPNGARYQAAPGPKAEGVIHTRSCGPTMR